MDLKNYVKCILGLFLVLWKNECVHSLKCEIGRSQQEHSLNLGCFKTADIGNTMNKNCHLLSCRKKEGVDWEIIDPTIGQLQIRFNGTPKYCKFDSYVVELEIYDEELPYNESLMCNTDNTAWTPHSRRLLENVTCSNCSDQFGETQCIQKHLVIFNYVYPGTYRLKIIPHVEHSTRLAQRSYRFLINSTMTHYVKKPISGLSLNASLQYRSISQELDLGIPLSIQPPDAVKIVLKYFSSYNTIIVHANTNSTDIACDEDDNIPWPSCQMLEEGVNCKFYNLTEGSYTLYISFIDDRCERRTIWTINHTEYCFWVIKKGFTAEDTVQGLTPVDDPANSHILYTSVIIVILIGALVTSFIVKKLNKRKEELANAILGKAASSASKSNTEQTYNFNGHSQKFNFGQFLTMTDRPKPEVLLLYARETPPFMELVACLRRVISKIFKCVVYDYFDPEMWNEVSTDPMGWVEALIVERQAKIIIVSSELGALQYRCVMGESPPRLYKTPHPFDHLFSFAIRLIRDGRMEDSYKNLFVITFDGITERTHMMEYFNPYTRFVLPKHLYKLFEHLHEPDMFKNLDVNRLEEKPEVRQLRMQLDHLKNLKLFGDIDLDARSMCG